MGMKKLSAGMRVNVLLTGAGFVTKEAKKVLRIDRRGVWLDNGPGNDPSGPFDANTGAYSHDLCAPGFSQRIEA